MDQKYTSTTGERPRVLGGVVPYLQLDGAIKAAAFYGRALGATEEARYEPDDKGRTMHVHLHVNGSSVMLSDAYPEHGFPHKEPQSFTMHLVVDDIDAWWARAVGAGMEVVMPVELMFWGDRYGQLRDPFGVSWSMSQPA